MFCTYLRSREDSIVEYDSSQDTWVINEKHKQTEMLRTGRMMVLVAVLMMTTMVALKTLIDD